MGRYFITIIISAFFSASSFGAGESTQFIFDQIEVDESRGAYFHLTNVKDDQEYAILDCGSFIHHLHLYDQHDKEIFRFFVDVSECLHLAEQYHQCIKEEGSLCVDTEDVFRPSCHCKN